MSDITPLELERSAAYLAGTYGLEWDNLPESAFWGNSKAKFRRRVIAAEAYSREVNRRYDRAREMSQAVSLPSPPETTI
jgi:hypothetical protein